MEWPMILTLLFCLPKRLVLLLVVLLYKKRLLRLFTRHPKEYAVQGSSSVLSSQAVLKHLTSDPKAFSSFILGNFSSSHHESLKAQKAINELFVKCNNHFSGVSRSFFRMSDNHTSGPDFSNLVSQIGSLSFDSTGLHWRFLLLLALASRNHPSLSSKILRKTAGHFLKSLKSHLPQTRILAISALNTLLKESPYKLSAGEKSVVSNDLQGNATSSLEGALTQLLRKRGFSVRHQIVFLMFI
ncbi:proteasome activator subunit 4-like isoform X2 [Neltuma alba]|uniref:proteasome activator subunit 4-like isoform X2 n=1 Tax=Neltuma alba TaxID=207710 RepID=UPI0010A46CFF|nr:proteasome activator subunit 4-like isoform X2 [Prosopis alba]